MVGLARLSPRSLAAVCAFMGSAVVTAGLFRAPFSVGRQGAAAPWALEPGFYVLVLACVGAALAFLSYVIKRAAAAAKAAGACDAELRLSEPRPELAPPLRERALASLVACLCGLAFGLGLGLSGMTDPTKVLRFLDFLGEGGWDPQLILVMGGGVAVNAVLWRAMAVGALKDVQPRFLLAVSESLPRARTLGEIINYGPACAANRGVCDARLLAGSLCFGVGWGLCGVCPGPGIVDYTTGRPHFGVVVPAMLLGGAVFEAGSRSLFG